MNQAPENCKHNKPSTELVSWATWGRVDYCTARQLQPTEAICQACTMFDPKLSKVILDKLTSLFSPPEETYTITDMVIDDQVNHAIAVGQEQAINNNLRSTWLRVAGSQMDEIQRSTALAYLDSLSLEEQNSKLNLVLTHLADVNSRGS